MGLFSGSCTFPVVILRAPAEMSLSNNLRQNVSGTRTLRGVPHLLICKNLIYFLYVSEIGRYGLRFWHALIRLNIYKKLKNCVLLTFCFQYFDHRSLLLLETSAPECSQPVCMLLCHMHHPISQIFCMVS